MGRYLKEAKFHAERIQHYYDYAGPMGYSQAKYDYLQLSNLILRAHQSKHDKSDAVLIRDIKQSADLLMEQMKKREEDDVKRRGDKGTERPN
jgi:hypothetical protein